MRVLVEDKAGEKVLGFEYIKPDAPIRPRDPEDTDPNDEGPDGGGGGVKVGTKTGARQAARQARPAQAAWRPPAVERSEPRAEGPARI